MHTLMEVNYKPQYYATKKKTLKDVVKIAILGALDAFIWDSCVYY